MTYRTRNILIISIVLFVCLAIGTTVAILIAKEQKEERELEQKYAALESELSPLKRERNALSNELITIDYKLEGKGYDLGTGFILITEPNAYFLDDMYPYLHSNGYLGILSIGASYFINNEGMMSPDQITGLVEHEGYELSMTITSNTNVSSLYENFERKGLPNPTIIYSPNGELSQEVITNIKTIGINNIITYGCDSKIEDEMFYIKAYGSYEEDTKEEFMNAVDLSMPLAITIGYINSYERYNATNFSNMLSAFESYKDQFPVDHVQIAKARYEEYLTKVENETDTLISRKAVIVARLEEIRSEIAKRSNWYGKG